MSTDFEDLGIMGEIIPKKAIVDFKLLSESFSDEEKFKQQVQNLSKETKLPSAFPSLPMFFGARIKGLVTNKDCWNAELLLPAVLYNSDAYNTNLELRGPMEEILLAYEKERIRQDLPVNSLVGDGWSNTFIKRFEKIHNQPVGKYEKRLRAVLDEEEKDRKLKGDLLKIKPITD